MPKTRKIALEAGKEQGIQEISPKATEELGVTCCFAAKAAELTGKWQGKLEFTVQLSHDETGIAFIQFPQKLFCKLLSETKPLSSVVLTSSASGPRGSRMASILPHP